MFSSANEAYLLIITGWAGHHVSYLWFPWLLFKQIFGAVESPEDLNGFLTTVHITASGAEKYVVPLPSSRNGGAGADPIHFTMIAGNIYAFCPSVQSICRHT